MFDTHAHLDMLNEPADAVIKRANDAGVTHIAAIGSTPKANQYVSGLSDRAIIKTVGLDRDQAVPGQTEDSLACMLDELRILAGAPGVRAIGETGIDFHYKSGTADEQIALFQAQLELARQLELPVTVHSREAEADTLACLSQHSAAWKGDPDRIGIIHCFTGSLDFALKAVHMGFMISFSGILTFRNADDLRSIAAALPDEFLLVETDAPFLAPEPYRGRKNEPAYLKQTVECLADTRNNTFEEMAAITEKNACRLFGLE